MIIGKIRKKGGESRICFAHRRWSQKEWQSEAKMSAERKKSTLFLAQTLTPERKGRNYQSWAGEKRAATTCVRGACKCTHVNAGLREIRGGRTIFALTPCERLGCKVTSHCWRGRESRVQSTHHQYRVAPDLLLPLVPKHSRLTMKSNSNDKEDFTTKSGECDASEKLKSPPAFFFFYVLPVVSPSPRHI